MRNSRVRSGKRNLSEACKEGRMSKILFYLNSDSIEHNLFCKIQMFLSSILMILHPGSCLRYSELADQLI